MTDPITSVHGVAQTKTLKQVVLQAIFDHMPMPFNDTQLTQAVEGLMDARIGRNVVARTRLTVEREGLIRRLPIEDADQREMQFVIE